MAHHVVFGASGGIGNAVVRELARQGHPTRGVNTTGKAVVPDGVEMMAGDAAQLDDVRRAVEGADVVYQCLFPAVQDAIIEAVADTGATLVVANNLYMYDPTRGPMSEDSPHAYGDRTGGKFYADMGEQALAAHREGRISATVGQASDIYGPNVRHGIGRDQVFDRLMAGKPANVLGDPDTVHTYTYADDCARALITLGQREQALGQTWHLPSAEPITTRELLTMICDELGVAPQDPGRQRPPAHGHGPVQQDHAQPEAGEGLPVHHPVARRSPPLRAGLRGRRHPPCRGGQADGGLVQGARHPVMAVARSAPSHPRSPGCGGRRRGRR